MHLESNHRDIIHDTQASSLNVERRQEDIWDWISSDQNKHVEAGNFINITDKDYHNLHTAFTKLVHDIKQASSRRPIGFYFNDREYTFVDDDQCRIHTSSNGTLRVELIMVRGGDKKQKLIHITYSLYKHNTAGYVLAFIGNPTTIVAGNNIRPARSDADSLTKEHLNFYKMGILLPEQIFANNKNPFLWSKTTKKDINRGKIKVSNTQWAMYLPSADKRIDLALLSGLYCSRLMHRTDSVSLGEHLGFHSTNVMRNQRNGKLSGVFLTRKKGANHILTINFYDKAESISNKQQGKTLSDLEMRIIKDAIRLDITAHSGYLKSIIRAAKKHAQTLIQYQPDLQKKLKVFLADQQDDNITAYKVCRAMSILAVVPDKQGNFITRGFTAWLAKKILDDELRLISILRKCHEAIDIDGIGDKQFQPILRFWKNNYYPDSGDFVDAACSSLDVKKSWVYKTRAKLYTDHGIDLFIPYEYWRDLATASSIYGMSDKEKELFYQIRMGMITDDKKVGQSIRKLFSKSNARIKNSSVQMLQSLKIVAKQVEAEYMPLLD